MRDVAYVLGAAGPAVADSVLGVDSPEMRPLDQGRALLGQVGALSDVEFSSAFNSGGGCVASAGAGDGAHTFNSCSAIQSFRPGAPWAQDEWQRCWSCPAMTSRRGAPGHLGTAAMDQDSRMLLRGGKGRCHLPAISTTAVRRGGKSFSSFRLRAYWACQVVLSGAEFGIHIYATYRCPTLAYTLTSTLG